MDELQNAAILFLGKPKFRYRFYFRRPLKTIYIPFQDYFVVSYLNEVPVNDTPVIESQTKGFAGIEITLNIIGTRELENGIIPK